MAGGPWRHWPARNVFVSSPGRTDIRRLHPSCRTCFGIHGRASPAMSGLAPAWMPKRVRHDEGGVAGGPWRHWPARNAFVSSPGRTGIRRLHPSCRTRFGIHGRASPAMSGLAPAWMPKRVRHDEGGWLVARGGIGQRATPSSAPRGEPASAASIRHAGLVSASMVVQVRPCPDWPRRGCRNKFGMTKGGLPWRIA